MRTRTYLGLRVTPSLSTAGLLAGDAVALGAFVWAGEVDHGFPPLSYPVRYLDSLAPFLLAWVAVAVLAGLYTDEAVTSVRRGLGRATLAWFVALPLAHALRASPVFHGGTAPTFFVVSGVVGGGLLLTWRGLAAKTMSPARTG